MKNRVITISREFGSGGRTIGKRVAEELGILFQEKDRGGLSDANHLAQCGDVVVLDGMGPHGANDHSEKEYGYIGSVEPCVRLLVRVLQDLAERK